MAVELNRFMSNRNVSIECVAQQCTVRASSLAQPLVVDFDQQFSDFLSMLSLQNEILLRRMNFFSLLTLLTF